MHVVFASAEMFPFSKVGGLADVVGSLGSALVAAGRKVTQFIPMTGKMDPASLSLSRRLTPVRVWMGGRDFEVDVFERRLASGVEVRVLREPGLLLRDQVYCDSADEPLRWGLFARAVLAVLANEGEVVDVIHAHDWHAALVPYHLRRTADRPAALENAACVLTIHNIEHQGQCSPDLIGPLGLDPADFTPACLEFYGRLNVLKAGIVTSDRVTTVSRTYAKEILGSAGGFGLDGVLGSLPAEVVGITNGIDTDTWDPTVDPRIEARYSDRYLEGKGRCKAALQAELGLPVRPASPLIAMVARLVHQKGVDLLVEASPRLLRSDVQLIVLGIGDPALERSLETLAGRFPDKVAFRRGLDEGLSHRAFAGCDMIVVPSRFEPCGLTQMIAMRYGAVPVARRTGGLADTVVDLDPRLETGNGFVFGEAGAVPLLGAMLRGVVAMSDREGWLALAGRLMRLDFSWRRSCARYAALYDSVTGPVA